MRFDNFTLEDIQAVHAIECEATEYPWSEKLFNDSVSSGHDCFCLRSDDGGGDTIVAFAIFSVVVDEASLLDIAVRPKFQGKGLGRSLLRSGLEVMLSKGAQSCILEVRESNHGAQELYYSFGFYEVGQRPGYYPRKKAGREDALLLCMPLSIESLEYDG